MVYLYLAVILISVLQGTPNALPVIVGVVPLIVIPCVVSIAMFEGETAGAAFGILGGLLWDIENGKPFGFNALFLMITCILISLLIQNLFRNTIVSAIIFCIVATFFQEFATWFFFVYLNGNENFLYAFFFIILPAIIYTLIFILPFYYLTKLLNNKFQNT